MSLASAIRRTTITTYDIEDSLRFYIDILGFKTWYDEVVKDPIVTKLLGVEPGVKVRVAILEAEPGNLGKIGLMQFIGQKMERKIPLDGPPSPGETVILFLTEQINQIRQNLLNAGYPVGEPERIDIPDRPPTFEMAVRDPDGVRLTFVQFNQLDGL